MSIQLEGAIKRYIGLSSDKKPEKDGSNADGFQTGKDLPPGSSFFETDTWKISRWDGSAWRYEEENRELISLLQEMRETNKQIAFLLELLVRKL